MSNLTNKGKLISRFEIGFDNETKADIDALKAKIDELTRALSVKNDSHGDRLLAAMQAEAANDAPQPELKKMGQWVFEGQPKEFVTAHVSSIGKAVLSSMPIDALEPDDYSWSVKEDVQTKIPTCLYRELKGEFDATNWQNSAISRETVNDVDYLSGCDLDECVPHIDDVLDNPNWLSEPVPQITQADMQLIFIKNLSECLVQRMHSMNRFSEDDYAIGGDKLMPWDIVVGKPYATKKEDHNVVRFGVISCQSRDLRVLQVLSFNESYCNARGESLAVYFSENNTYRTITKDELPAFRAALEACYA